MKNKIQIDALEDFIDNFPGELIIRNNEIYFNGVLIAKYVKTC